MGQSGSCNCISKVHKPNPGFEVVESQPTLLTSEPVLATLPPTRKQSSYSQCSTEPSLSRCIEAGMTPTSRDQRCQSSSAGMTPMSRDQRCQSSSVGMTPTSRDQRCQSSSEYKYDMRQLLAMAEMREQAELREESRLTKAHSNSTSALQQGPQQHQPTALCHQANSNSTPALQQGQQHQPMALCHQANSNSTSALQQGQQHQPTANAAQSPYQVSSSTRFQQIPHTVPLAPGVDRLDPVVVQQLLRNRQCILVDVRGDDRNVGTIEGAVNVPAVDAVPFSVRLPECVRQWANQPVVIFHCQYSAHRAPQCANCYREQAPEHQRVAIMDGGFRGWESVGLPVQQGTVQQGVQGLNGQQFYNMYALQQGMQFALPAQQSARAN